MKHLTKLGGDGVYYLYIMSAGNCTTGGSGGLSSTSCYINCD